ncbi:MAG: hypothetical protein CVU57_12940 [Deltaproteobacteria bacterium HGW-Deltaproteobacteria-15]|jgi:hypothetical protein|nr:MAG: hypothetical protein CVU57_12940 [Deltaproteobacteria bacterium HGW-Deltaproteobacteria-15]
MQQMENLEEFTWHTSKNLNTGSFLRGIGLVLAAIRRPILSNVPSKWISSCRTGWCNNRTLSFNRHTLSNISSPRKRRMGKIIAGILFMLSLAHVGVVYSEDKTFYSIHIASFKDLESAGKFVSDIGSKEKIVFWKETDVPGKGIYFRVYTGRFETREDAVTVWNRMNDAGQVSYFGVHKFTEPLVQPVIPESPPPAPPGREPSRPEKTIGNKSAAGADRFLDNKDGTITDLQTGLMWAKNGWRLEFFAATTWDDAVHKCEKLKLGNHSNWRLPTVEEWRTLLDGSKECPALVEPNPFSNMIVHMPYWSRTEFTYGTDYTCDDVCPIRAYTVSLYYGNIQNRNKNERAFVLPVRTQQ